MTPHITILDGAMGTELRARGATVPDYRSSAWSAMALVHDPDTVRQVHSDYIAAGADVITANNYAVVPNLLARVGMAEGLEDLTRLACRLALEARAANSRPEVRVAGSLPPLDTTYESDRVRPEQELFEVYLRIARVLAAANVDLVMAETLTTVREAVAAARAAAECGLPVWVSWNLRLDAPIIRGGESLQQGIAALEPLPVAGYMVNCVPTGLVQPALELMRRCTDRPLGAYANSCEHAADQASLDANAATLSPQQYVTASERWVEAGATVIGGCCDTRPEYIAALAACWK